VDLLGLKRCIKCGYILDGLTDSRCPECGQEFDLRWPESYFTGRPKYAGWEYLLLALLAPLACAAITAMILDLSRRVIPASHIWMFLFLGTQLVTFATELYIAVRSARELQRPASLRQRRICWVIALALSLLAAFGFCGLSVLVLCSLGV
jgi:hypothetical protein